MLCFKGQGWQISIDLDKLPPAYPIAYRKEHHKHEDTDQTIKDFNTKPSDTEYGEP